MKHPRITTGYIRHIDGEYHSFLYFTWPIDSLSQNSAVEVNWTRNRWVWW